MAILHRKQELLRDKRKIARPQFSNRSTFNSSSKYEIYKVIQIELPKLLN